MSILPAKRKRSTILDEDDDEPLQVQSFLPRTSKLNFTSQWNNPLFSDIQLRFQGDSSEVYHLHRNVLANSSDFFYALFTSGMNDARTSEITLEIDAGSKEAEIVLALLRDAYAGELELTSSEIEHLVHMIEVAAKYQFSSAEQRLAQHITDTYLCPIAVSSDPELTPNLGHIWATFDLIFGNKYPDMTYYGKIAFSRHAYRMMRMDEILALEYDELVRVMQMTMHPDLGMDWTTTAQRWINVSPVVRGQLAYKLLQEVNAAYRSSLIEFVLDGNMHASFPNRTDDRTVLASVDELPQMAILPMSHSTNNGELPSFFELVFKIDRAPCSIGLYDRTSAAECNATWDEDDELVQISSKGTFQNGKDPQQGNFSFQTGDVIVMTYNTRRTAGSEPVTTVSWSKRGKDQQDVLLHSCILKRNPDLIYVPGVVLEGERSQVTLLSANVSID